MKNGSVSVSVIMPVYNSKRYLEACVRSILKQDFNSYELLLIDDGSSDGSSELCDRLALEDDKIKVYHKVNEGICKARNFGLEHAHGEYIAFSDHDDIVNEGFLKDNYSYAVSTGADVVKFGREAIIIANDKIVKIDKRCFAERILEKDEIKSEFLKLRFDGAMTCVWDGLFKREFLSRNGLCFDSRYTKGGEDIEFCSNCFIKATKIAFHIGIYYEHYIRIGYSTSTMPDDKRLEKFKMLTENLISCVDFLNIEKKNNPLLFINVVKELVYPSLVYFRSVNENYNRVKQYIKNECDRYKRYSPSSIALIRTDYRWGLYSVLFKLGNYRVMYEVIKLKELKV